MDLHQNSVLNSWSHVVINIYNMSKLFWKSYGISIEALILQWLFPVEDKHFHSNGMTINAIYSPL